MKKFTHIFILPVALFLGVTTAAYGQRVYSGQVTVENLTGIKENNTLSVYMDIVLDALKIGSDEMLTLTPVLTANTGTQSRALPPAVVNGGRRQKMVERARVLNGDPVFAETPRTVLKRNNNTRQTINYSAAVPLESWMSDASLKLVKNATGCAECDKGSGEQLLTGRVLREPYMPIYKLTYIVPEVEPVKARSDRHTATFNYVVGKHDLVRNYKNNAVEFDRADRVINEVKGNKDLNITEFTVSGYASPEGNHNSNRALSDRRANSFADYLSNAHGISRSRFKVTGYGEDWDGLEQAVEKSALADRNEILRIINNVANPDSRDAELMKLSNGQTYRTLLENYYPPLRRTDYTIAYNVRAFSVEEAKEVIRTNPKLLSLNEMYLVAQTYPENSKEFKEVFDIATRLYPNEPIAILNSAAADIEGGNHQAAIDRLNRIENDPRSWNNLGVGHARMSNPAKAKEYFEKAAARGDADAKANLEELNKTTKD